jgi:tetratricopeptide (TPR) repeat protein
MQTTKKDDQIVNKVVEKVLKEFDFEIDDLLEEGEREEIEQAVKEDPLMEEAWEAQAGMATMLAEHAPDESRQEQWWLKGEVYCTDGLSHDRGYVPHLLARGAIRAIRGTAHAQRGQDPLRDYSDAEADFTEALRLDKESWEALQSRADVRGDRASYRKFRDDSALLDIDSAEKDYSEALKISGNKKDVFRGRALNRRNRGFYRMEHKQDPLEDWAGAEADLDRALEIVADFFNGEKEEVKMFFSEGKRSATGL